MTVQRLHSSLAPVDLLTRLEMEEITHKGMSDFVQQLYRGVDWIEWNGDAGGATTFTIPFGPDSGYAWSLKLISVVLAGTGNVSVFLGENTNFAPIAGGAATEMANSTYVYLETYGSNCAVFKDSKLITLTADADMSSIKILAKQVPAEMIGKL